MLYDSYLLQIYTRRWFILGLFALYSLTNAYQWIHLSIISDVMLAFYNESLPGDTINTKVSACPAAANHYYDFKSVLDGQSCPPLVLNASTNM